MNTQVEIRFQPSEAEWMGEDLQERFLEVHGGKLTKVMRLTVFVLSCEDGRDGHCFFITKKTRGKYERLPP